MSRQFRFSLTTALLVLTCCALAIGWLSTVERPKPPLTQPYRPSDDQIRGLPITISANVIGRFASGNSWILSLNSAGQAEVTIFAANDSVHRFVVSQEQLNQLRELLISSSFFSLKDEYGDIVPDGSTQTLTITVGEWTKTVRISFLGNWVAVRDTAKLREPARALRVWVLIRSWFSYPDAVDFRQYDQQLLKAIDGASGAGN